MNNPVIVTRPLVQAAVLARQVEAIGREAIVFPLIEIHPLVDVAPLKAALNDLPVYDMVVFVSPNAIDAACALRPDWPAAITFAIMGEGSRAALAQQGITEVNARIVRPRDPAHSDSQALLAALDLAVLRGRRVLIIRGEHGREFLADSLRQAGVGVTQIAAYRRSTPVLDAARSRQLVRLLDVSGQWIMTSSEALRTLLSMVRQVAQEPGVAKMQRQSLFVPHVRIQETARMLGFLDVTLTGSGNDSLLSALQFRA